MTSALKRKTATGTEIVPIALGERSYEIVIGRGLLDQSDSFDAVGGRGRRAMVVTNSTVRPLYADRLLASLNAYEAIDVVELPDGEAYKDAATLNLIFDALLTNACDRKTTLYALGGGVVGDITGFAAACYMRGIPYVQVPTTLLAQVDSSVGGKTAINHPLGKNMIGAFHQPRRVVADLDTLDTLPQRELIAGLAEVIKYGPITDLGFIDWLEQNIDALLARDKTALSLVIAHSCRLKAEVVSVDEREAGRRAILNFGHTFGHAIEAALGYGQWLHGEAVGFGMVLASRLSERVGLLSRGDVGRLSTLIERAGLPTKMPEIETRAMINLMHVDKKVEGGELRFVLLDGLGRAIVRSVPDHVVAEVIDTSRR